MSFTVRNKLEILRGNKIIVPGCEPTSAFTSPTLAENRDCKASVVDLKDAIAAIPDATIESWGNPRTRFFVLPDGPGPAMGDCDCKQTDWYQILRDISEEVNVPTTNPCDKWPKSVGEICDAFPLRGVF
jgi:hypothetical protein